MRRNCAYIVFMKNLPSKVALGLLLFLFSGVLIQGQASTSSKGAAITISAEEPASISLQDLFKTSDVVATVRILSGDTENYKVVIYKAQVVRSFKGSSDGKILYFGPFIGMRLGDESVVFLRAAKERAEPVNPKSSPYGVVDYFEIFNQGYSGMQIDYKCVFEGKNPDESCQSAVRVCTDYILLPKQIPTFPPKEVETDFGCRWVRKSNFESILAGIGKN